MTYLLILIKFKHFSIIFILFYWYKKDKKPTLFKMYKCVLMCRTDNTGSPDQENKMMVFRSNLLDLFKSCPLCCADTIGVISKIWRNQPYVRNMPVANYVFGAIIASGCMPAKVLRLFKLLGLNSISSSTFHSITLIRRLVSAGYPTPTSGPTQYW